MPRRFFSRCLALALAVGLAGCASTGYYFQAVSGQVELWQRSEPINDVISRSDTDSKIREKLIRIREIREFASRELKLPDNGSYQKYVDLKRPYVVWNVFATEELSVTPKEWCVLIVGCVSYRGYFSKESAEKYAAELRSQGYDVHIGGVPAYSTLGYFDDPVLSTFMDYSETELARLIFHELAHQLLYVKDDTMFNESFAAAVEMEGVRRWIDINGKPNEHTLFAQQQSRREDYIRFLSKHRNKLHALYVSAQSVDEKRAGKARLFQEMKDDYKRLKAQWGGYSGYDRILTQNLNNAFLVSSSLYNHLVPAFQALLTRNRGDMKRFYEASQLLALQPKNARETDLAALMQGGGGGTAVAAPDR